MEDYLLEPYHKVRVDAGIELLLSYLSHQEGAPIVIDVAAGSGYASGLLRQSGCLPLVADENSDVLQSVRKSRIESVKLDVTQPLPFRSSSVDGVFAGEIIEHLYDPMAFLAELRRILKPNGILVVTTPNLATIQDRMEFLFGKSPRQIDPSHEYLRLHIRPFTATRLAKALKDTGYQELRLTSNFVTWRTSHSEFLCRWLAKALPTLGGSLVMAARAV